MSGVVVAGAGLAALRCAETLRAGGYAGRILLVGEEPHLPYDRPALSKELLAGTRAAHELHLRDVSRLQELEIDISVGSRVDWLDVRRRTATTGSTELRWDAFVLATGARARRPDWAAGARALRTLDDALSLRDALAACGRVTVVGGGFVGTEVASTACALGVAVTLVEAGSQPLAAALGPEVGAIVARRARAAGVDVRTGIGVARLDARTVTLADGTAIEADETLVAVGAAPAGELLGTGAVPVDACGRTALEGVYACGDVAVWNGRRTEHWTDAQAHGAAVASAILEDPVPYVAAPYVWSDVFGLRLQLVGDSRSSETVTLEGEESEFRATYYNAQGRRCAVLLANRPGEIAAARRELAAAA